MSKSIFQIFAVFILLSSASGQELASKTKPGADSKTERELNTKAEALLTEIARNTQGLKNRENQIIARMAVAELLWKDHETSARVLYREAFDNLRQALTQADDVEPEADDVQHDLFQLRDRVLESLGQRDPLMARDLLRLSRVPLPSDSAASDRPNTSTDVNSDARLELLFATELVDKNPTEALRVGKEALNEGYPQGLISLLSKLQKNEPKAARALAEEIVSKLRKANFDSNYEAMSLAVGLVQEVTSSTKVKEEGSANERKALLDPQTSREFIEFLVDTGLKKQSGPGGMSLLLNLRSIAGLEELAPAQAALIKQKFDEIAKASGEADDPYQRFQQVSQTSDTKAMLEIAQKAPREVREGLYAQAASLAWQKGDKAKANEIITTRISSPIERRRLLASFQEQTIAELIGREEFGEARRLIAQIRSGEQRVAQLIELAAAVTEKGDKKAALEILQEAQGLMTSKARNANELEAQVRIAEAYSAIDVDRSFALIGAAFDQINELLAATALIANFGAGPMTIKDGEFVIDSSSIFPYGFATFSSGSIRRLAQADFDKTKEMFERLQRPEIRIAAYIFMSKSILEPEPTGDCTCPEELKKLESKAAK